MGALSEITTRLSYFEPELGVAFSVAEGTATEGYDAEALSHGASGTLVAALVSRLPNVLICAGVLPDPAVLNMCHRKKIPVALVEPPIAQIQKRPWLWRKTILAPALRHVDRIWARTEAEASLWQSFGGRPTRTDAGPALREGYAAPIINEAERADLSRLMATRPLWFVHRLPKEELTWVTRAIQTAQRSWPRLVTAIEPGIDLQSKVVNDALESAGLVVHQRDQNEDPNEQTQVYITDGPEEAGIWYHLAALTYLGGTLSGKPSANPMIGASVGSAMIHGPRILRHRSAFERLFDAGATKRIAHGHHLGDTVAEHLAPDLCAHLAHRGWHVVSEGAEMSNLLVEYVAEQLGLDLED